MTGEAAQNTSRDLAAEVEALELEVRVLRARLAAAEHDHAQVTKRKQRRIEALTEALRVAEISAS